MIPRLLHFVFGLEEQHEPFHFGHFMAIEAARKMVQPEQIYFHHKHLPYGPLWDELAPALTLVEVDLTPAVLAADYSGGHVPAQYRYAHHSDFVRLEALIEHGGVYVDIDMVLVRPLPEELYLHPFVIGEEEPTRDEITGELRPSLCNAFLMAEKGSSFARAWREEMSSSLNGTWSNHSGFLSKHLSEEMPDAVHVEPPATFFPFGSDRAGLSEIFVGRRELDSSTLGVHLWAHLWWEPSRRDFVPAHAGWWTPAALRCARTTLGELARPYLPAADAASGQESQRRPWLYFSYDEPSGYSEAASRCRRAIEQTGQRLSWTPFLSGLSDVHPYVPPEPLYPYSPLSEHSDGECGRARLRERDQVVVAHLVPEYFPLVRTDCGDAFLVGHTAWETDQIPHHWHECLETADLLVAPSSFSARAIEASPVTTPVEVVPHVAPDTSRPASSSFESIPDDFFVFYTIAVWDERKAVQKTIEAYLRAFRRDDRVLLIVKTSALDGRRRLERLPRVGEEGSSARSLADMLGSHELPPQVLLLTSELPEADIVALHRRGDCFVSLARSEGWGLGAFDAAVYGNPVVTTGYGGQLDYLGDSPYLVDYSLVPVEHPMGYPSYAPYQSWAEPDLDHAVELLRRVYAEQERARQAAFLLAGELEERYSSEAVGQLFCQVVAEHCERAARGR